MPAREVSLVAGSSGVGKTKLIIQIVQALETGTEIFGRATRQTSCLYVACDRGTDSFKRSLDGYGLAYSAFAWASERDIPRAAARTRPYQIMKWAAVRHPEARLVVLDGLSGLVPDFCNYHEVAVMFREVQALCQDQNQTILGTVHATKVKTLDKICNPRERVVGSVAWGGFSEMVVSMDHEDPQDPENPFRVVNVCNHSGPNLRLRVRYNALGRLMVVEQDSDLAELLDQAVLGAIPASGLTKGDVVELARTLGPAITVAAVERWLAQAALDGRLCKTGLTRDTRYLLPGSALVS